MTYFKHNAFTGEMYLSKHDTEFLGLPVGNPFSGAAFKQKQMPFFIAPAFAAAGAAIGTAAAATTLTAGLVGTAIGASVVALGTVATVAGIGMTVVGAITGDKGLMKLGGIVGLAGGITGMAVGGAMAAASGGSFLSGMGSMGVAGVNTANSTIAAEAATQLASTGAMGIDAALSTTPTAMAQASAAANSSPILSGVTQSPSVLGTSLSSGARTAAQAVQPLMTPINATSTFNAATDAVNVAANAPAASAGFFDSMLDPSKWTTSDKLLAGGAIVKTVGGVADSISKNDQLEYEKKQREQRIANLNEQPQITGMFGFDAYGNKVETNFNPVKSTNGLLQGVTTGGNK